jgi:hypothetical protein
MQGNKLATLVENIQFLRASPGRMRIDVEALYRAGPPLQILVPSLAVFRMPRSSARMRAF